MFPAKRTDDTMRVLKNNMKSGYQYVLSESALARMGGCCDEAAISFRYLVWLSGFSCHWMLTNESTRLNCQDSHSLVNLEISEYSKPGTHNFQMFIIKLKPELSQLNAFNMNFLTCWVKL